MTYQELTDIFAKGENISVEFKKSTTDIPKDVYETVCSFSNSRSSISRFFSIVRS